MIPKVINAIEDMRCALDACSGTIAFVPTMGALHDGHLRLVQAAREHADVVVASIFVNDFQFGVNEDFSHYPRTFEQDLEKLAAHNVDYLFAPDSKVLYPNGIGDALVFVNGGHLFSKYCGKTRPVFFRGILTVVAKFLNIIQPHYTFFGEKDFQQLFLIKQMVNDLNFPVTVLSVPIVREANGLALSSRNVYLTSEQRSIASELFKVLSQAKQVICSGERNYSMLEQGCSKQLSEHGFVVDYFSVVDADTLLEVSEGTEHIVILAAVWLNKIRLIDNVAFRI